MLYIFGTLSLLSMYEARFFEFRISLVHSFQFFIFRFPKFYFRNSFTELLPMDAACKKEHFGMSHDEISWLDRTIAPKFKLNFIRLNSAKFKFW